MDHSVKQLIGVLVELTPPLQRSEARALDTAVREAAWHNHRPTPPSGMKSIKPRIVELERPAKGNHTSTLSSAWRVGGGHASASNRTYPSPRGASLRWRGGEVH